MPTQVLSQGRWLMVPSMVAFVIFSWLPNSYHRMVAWPWILIWEIGWITLLVGGIWQLRQLQQPFRLLGYGLDGVILGLAIVAVFSSLASPFPQIALWNISLALTYGIGLYLYRNWLSARYALWVLLVAVATVAAIFSLVLWQPTLAMWQSSSFYEAVRNSQPMGHHNFVGGYFALMLPLAVAGAVAVFKHEIGGQCPPYKLIAVVPAGLMLVALYASGSRGAMVGCLVWLLLTWLNLIVRAAAKHRWRWGLMSFVGICIALLGLVTNPRIRTWFGPILSGYPTIVITDGPTLDRWFMLRQGVNILQDRPLLGVGPGVMSRVSNLYRPIEVGAGLDHIQQLHNTPMQIAGELGLAGLFLALLGLLVLARLIWQLWQQPLTSCDRTLLGGIIGSFTTYGIASLTDYQLENIPIAGTLLALVLLVLNLADDIFASTHQPKQNLPFGNPFPNVFSKQAHPPPTPKNPQIQHPSPIHPSTPYPSTPSPTSPTSPTHPPTHSLSPFLRRILSLSLWAWLGILVCLWLPFTLSIGFTNQAAHALQLQRFSTVEYYWYKASRLYPWDPTAAALASQHLYKLHTMMQKSVRRDEIRTLMLDYARLTESVAPNDVWFNQNLAVMLQAKPAKALPFAQKAVQLLPRNSNYGYFLLGKLLLALDQPQQATAAFTLEALVNPASLTSPLWQQAPLNDIYSAVIASTLAEYNHLLQQLDKHASGYAALRQVYALVSWWSGRPLSQSQRDSLPPVVQSVILAATDPESALAKVEDLIATDQTSASLYLIAAWLNPDLYWPPYAEHPNALPEPTLTKVQESLSQRPLHLWLRSAAAPPAPSYRMALSFAYRNQQAQGIRQILKPEGLEIAPIISALNLFPQWPREFPALDRYIEALKAELLNLPHPTQKRA
jgi:putative inorganic carbon (HCO3(-)) transporter